MALNNNQMNTILEDCVRLGWGGILNPKYNATKDEGSTGTDSDGHKKFLDAETVKGKINLQNIIDTGNDTDIFSNDNVKEQYTKALLNAVIKNWFKDSSYRSTYSDPFFIDSEQFGAYVQTISMEYPDAKPSTAWDDFTSDGKKVGQYEVYIPVVHAEIYGKTVSWEINVTITGEQWDTAFKNAGELASFISYVHMMIDNALVMHLESLDMANRNNFIAEKYALDKEGTSSGCNVVNLCEAVYKLNPAVAVGGSVTVDALLNNPVATDLAISVLNGYSTKLTKPSTLFNTADRVRFTPVERQVGQIQSDFYGAMMSNALVSNHLGRTALKDVYTEIPYWQTSGDTYDIADCTALALTTADGAEVDTKADSAVIVGLLVDKYAIAHTIKSRRVVAKYFEPEDLTTTFNQFRDMYSNDLTCNGIVFIAKDYTPAEPQARTVKSK